MKDECLDRIYVSVMRTFGFCAKWLKEYSRCMDDGFSFDLHSVF